MKTETALAEYSAFMQEIKHRIHVVNSCLKSHKSGSSLTGFRESDIELCFLHFRKILELIMYSSIIAHFAEGIQLQDRIVNKEFHASKILKFLRQTNPKFYPSPKREVESTDGVHNVDTLEDGFLTESNFCELYDKSCGNLMHAKRKNPFAGKHNDYFNEIETYVNKIIGLLNHHWVHVTDDVVFAVIMQADTNGDVHVAKLAAVATKSM